MVEDLTQSELDTEQRERPRFMPDPAQVLVIFSDLKALGIPHTLNHLRRLWKRGLFPSPLQISEHRIAWRLSDLQEWLANLQPVDTAPGAATPKKLTPTEPAPAAPAKAKRRIGPYRRR